MRTDLDPNVICVQVKGVLESRIIRITKQEQSRTHATSLLNILAKHKNAPTLGQGEEESSAVCG
jgi:hypothetical protein